MASTSLLLRSWHEIAKWTYKNLFHCKWTTFVATNSNSLNRPGASGTGFESFCGWIKKILRVSLTVITAVPCKISESWGRNFNPICNTFILLMALTFVAPKLNAALNAAEFKSGWNCIWYSWKSLDCPKNCRDCITSYLSAIKVGNTETWIGSLLGRPEGSCKTISFGGSKNNPIFNSFVKETISRQRSISATEGDPTFHGGNSTLSRPFTRILTMAEISETGRFSGSFCQASMAELPATPVSITMPSINIHQPNSPIHLCGLYSPKNRSFNQSDNFSKASPPNTANPPIVAHTNADSNEDEDSKKLISAWCICESILAGFAIMCAVIYRFCQSH